MRKIFPILLTLFFVFALSLFKVESSPISQEENLDFTITPTPIPAIITATLDQQVTETVLNWVSEETGLNTEELEIVGAFDYESLTLQRSFKIVTVADNINFHFYKVAIDLKTLEVLDLPEVTLNQSESYYAVYGAIDPILQNRLSGMNEEDAVSVIIWSVNENNQGFNEYQIEVFQTLAHAYPVVQELVSEGRRPFYVSGNSELSATIYEEYMNIIRDKFESQTSNLANQIESDGYNVTSLEFVPAVLAELPKIYIQELATNELVGNIQLADVGEPIALLGNQTATTRISYVFERGNNDGTGVRVAVLENGNIDDDSPSNSSCPSGNNCFRHVPIPTRLGTTDPSQIEHATHVGSVIASDHPTHGGVAPGVSLVSAGMTNGTLQEAYDALLWSTNQGARIINVSIAYCSAGNQLSAVDKLFDSFVSGLLTNVVVASGNLPACGEYVSSPGKGWNVTTVGYSNPNSNGNWSDDIVDPWSAWRNPINTLGNHEKPELIAPAKNIALIGPNGILHGNFGGDYQGSSLAAPHVAGVMALLQKRNGALDHEPEAMRSILMASAIQNLEGPSLVPDEDFLAVSDLKDGVGSIDANLADTIAPNGPTLPSTTCNSPCWWAYSRGATSHPGNTYDYQFFTATRGERIRVAISWLHPADCQNPTNCYYNSLTTDLDLKIFDANGQPITGVESHSLANNYEVVEFTAPQTGTYKIGIYKNKPPQVPEYSYYVGVAWSRQATYLPQLANNSIHKSQIYVRNDGAEPQIVNINYFDANGNNTNPNGLSQDTCYLSPSQWCYISVADLNRIPLGTRGSAIVSGSEDVSVTVLNDDGTWKKVAGYSGASANTEIHVPLIHSNDTEWFTNLYVQNAGRSSASVTVEYKAAQFGNDCTQTYTIPAGAATQLNLLNVSCIGTTFRGSARLVGNQPISVVSELFRSEGTYLQNVAIRASTNQSLVTYLSNAPGGFLSSITMQNASSTSSGFSVIYYRSETASQCSSINIGTQDPFHHFKIYPAPPTGSGAGCGPIGNPPTDSAITARITSANTLATTVNQTSNSGSTIAGGSYTATPYGRRTIILPLVRYSQTGWGGAIRVQNVGTQSSTITAWYYNSNGNLAHQVVYTTVPPNYMLTLVNVPGGGAFTGSVVITSTDLVTAIASQSKFYSSGDNMMYYEGIYR